MSDFRRANYAPVDTSGKALDFLQAEYLNLRLSLPAVRQMVVVEGFEANLFSISHDVYGDIGLWWLLAQFNNIIDPITDVTVGMVLYLPDVSDIENFLQNTSSSSSLPTVVL